MNPTMKLITTMALFVSREIKQHLTWHNSGSKRVGAAGPPGDAAAGRYVVDARRAKGVVIGDNATQHNSF
ncbi:hypothetical protein [Actinoplanes sp. GCM10030250]|uniref:hypothetical protein n=1 Tax=Actinoplanes sp. GCM10030250 TaxID=3273376 RepID=UPI003621A954